MDEVKEFLVQVEREEEIQRLEDENYFAEQDKQFKELQKKLINLKEENKRQMDIIINNLDELIANKALIEKTLDEIDDQSDTLVPEFKSLSIVDVLSTVTDFQNENQTSRFDIPNKDKENNSPATKSKAEKSKDSITKDKPDVSQEESDTEKDPLNDSSSFQELCDEYIDKIKISPIDLNFDTLTTQKPDD